MGLPTDTQQSHDIPDLSTLPESVRALFQQAFGDATGHLFLVALPFAVVALVCVVFIREVPLRTTILREDEVAPVAGVRGGRDGGKPCRALTSSAASSRRSASSSAASSG